MPFQKGKRSALLKKTAVEKHREAVRKFARRRVYMATILEEVGIDASNLPKNSKLIRLKEKGSDTWWVYTYDYEGPRTICRKYKIGRFNIPGSDPSNSKYPDFIVGRNPVMPGFARFYLEHKIGYNISENRLLEMLGQMRVNIPQSTLNFWMLQIMETLRIHLEGHLLYTIRKSRVTQNDETRILVRSRLKQGMPFGYKIEYVHAVLSMEQRLVAMLYDEGSRGHEV